MLFPEVFGRNHFDVFDELDNFFDRTNLNRAMKTDVKETANGYELTVDLPGVRKEDVKAELHEGYLTICVTAQKNQEQEQEDGKYIRRERYTGNYSRSFFVGKDVTEEEIQAKFTDGVLKLNVPKKEPAVPEKKYISIQD